VGGDSGIREGGLVVCSSPLLAGFPCLCPAFFQPRKGKNALSSQVRSTGGSGLR
jgi:hypothetical protein